MLLAASAKWGLFDVVQEVQRVLVPRDGSCGPHVFQEGTHASCLVCPSTSSLVYLLAM